MLDTFPRDPPRGEKGDEHSGATHPSVRTCRSRESRNCPGHLPSRSRYQLKPDSTNAYSSTRVARSSSFASFLSLPARLSASNRLDAFSLFIPHGLTRVVFRHDRSLQTLPIFCFISYRIVIEHSFLFHLHVSAPFYFISAAVAVEPTTEAVSFKQQYLDTRNIFIYRREDIYDISRTKMQIRRQIQCQFRSFFTGNAKRKVCQKRTFTFKTEIEPIRYPCGFLSVIYDSYVLSMSYHHRFDMNRAAIRLFIY